MGESVMIFDGKYKTVGMVSKVLNWYAEGHCDWNTGQCYDGDEHYIVTCKYSHQIDYQKNMEELRSKK